jgi:hypothetical protein
MQPSVVRESPRLVRVLLSGRVTPQEWNAALGEAAKLLQADEQTAILVTADGFEGWEPGGGWDDLSYRRLFEERVSRMAIVADRKWEDQALMFAGKGLRRFDVEFFAPAELARARAWLTASA